MANAEEIAMKKIVDEEEKSTRRYKNITTEPDTMAASSSKVERVTKLVLKKLSKHLQSHQLNQKIPRRSHSKFHQLNQKNLRREISKIFN
jgi:hypothetical protein